jgi:hypothetical protein
MTPAGAKPETDFSDAGQHPPARGVAAMFKLLRPHQWAKGAFVLVGPFYGGVIGHAGVAAAVACTLRAVIL